MEHPHHHLNDGDYTVACICPMGAELAPVIAMLDELHERLPTSRDVNSYTLGHIGARTTLSLQLYQRLATTVRRP
jgi:hypothetical protein